MNYLIKIEGQEIPVPEEIGKSDESVKQVLTPYYPQAANSLITRVQKDDLVTITVVKQAGTKGVMIPDEEILEGLIQCEGGKNSAVALYEVFRENIPFKDPYTLLRMSGEIDEALSKGQDEAHMCDQSFQRIVESQAQPASIVVPGF